ncbi:hypothetical protein ETAA8_11550 [Anatilimnocola aggregata]|uniref:N-acetyltransferase domain-containing protein n=1 Tax=Anatilimnocola aggregata TaxID=2528021 RepID=A0A517Y772_9BACT|nr:GNAT family N-acetyltransferase [Anatilimnocola aggregata]QDU26081.1 hypothetical protein ETAA8_11550 [Anatilimnocola aggregata]
MDPVVVTPVRTWRDQSRFLAFSWELYKDDPHWVPPLKANHLELLGYRKHPFYDDAEIQTFLATRAGKVVGHIAAIVNHSHNRVQGDRRGFVGFFESIDDEEVAHALFRTADDWLAERGMTGARGPANPSMNYECGLLVKGFDSPPTLMMTYNPSYYARLWESYGYGKSQDLFAYEGDRDQFPQLQKMIAPLAEQAQRRCQATVRPLNKKRFMDDVLSFFELYNLSFTTMWGFSPPSRREMIKMATSMQQLILPDLVSIVEVEGKVVGAMIGLPDYNPRIKEIKGNLFPFGFIKLLWTGKPFQRIRILSINVMPEFQRWGLGMVLMSDLLPRSIARGIPEAEFSWISEDNEVARMGVEKGGGTLTKIFRMYDRDFA